MVIFGSFSRWAFVGGPGARAGALAGTVQALEPTVLLIQEFHLDLTVQFRDHVDVPFFLRRTVAFMIEDRLLHVFEFAHLHLALLLNGLVTHLIYYLQSF